MDALQVLADIFLSQIAVGIYAIALLALFIVLIVSVTRYEKEASDAIDEADRWAKEMKALPLQLAEIQSGKEQPAEEEEEPFQIARNEDIHRGRIRLIKLPAFIIHTGVYEIGEDIVLV